jgi:mRNA interferase MazF
MIEFRRGDVVLINFVFSDESGGKLRPAVIISSENYHQGRNEAIISAITSQTSRFLTGDHLIAGWKKAGLLFPSVATGIIRTIKQDMINRKLGIMPATDMQEIDNKLQIMLALLSSRT